MKLTPVATNKEREALARRYHSFDPDPASDQGFRCLVCGQDQWYWPHDRSAPAPPPGFYGENDDGVRI